MPDATDVAISVTNTVGSAARLALTVGRNALPIIQFVAGFVPGAAPVVQAIGWALPVIDKIAQYAPAVAQFEGNERDLINHLAAVAPNAIGHIRDLYVQAMEKDGKPVDAMADVGAHLLYDFMFKDLLLFSPLTPNDPRILRQGMVNY